MANLALGNTLHGFTITSQEHLEEIDGIAWVMHHEASGARLLFLQNNNENKAFSIAFKTPPGNDTGVFHILEHSVLCGSDRFPVKEPFVNLLKSSMQTFLNAMTFPDKTMYPVSSTNEQDLLNLMDVYMDAVFHPAIFGKKEIFLQEGWHYELEGTPDEPKLIHNGVVFNEMKGALSNSQSVLFDVLQMALFPDTAYRFESGGTPEGIVELTYEMFLDEHRAHYRTDNSSIVLYGDMDIERVLEFLDSRYLKPLAAEYARDEAKKGGAFTPRELALQAPVVAEGVVHEMETAPENACCALGYVVGTAADREKIYAVDILLDALLGSNEAPLKRALLDANLGDDIGQTLADSMLQPFAIVTLKGAKPDMLPRFQQITEEAVRAILDEGIDPKIIEASLSHTEFVLREADFGISDGVALAISSLSGWLYDTDDSLATAYIRYEDVLSELRTKIGTSYFDDLAREIFLECPHRASVEVKPVEAVSPSAEETQLEKVLASMDESRLAEIAEQVEILRMAQEQPDSLEAIATLPKLSVKDIGPAKIRSRYSLCENLSFPCVHHEANTHGLAYVRRFYDASCFTFEELPYLSILTSLLGKLDTARHTAAEIDTLVQTYLGDLTFYKEVFGPDCDSQTSIPAGVFPADADDVRTPREMVQLAAVVSASSLGENTQALCSIPAEIMYETDFSDTDKIRSILQQIRFSIEQQFALSGHTAARCRASSYHSYSAVLSETLGGVDFYRFLKDLLAHFDERAETLSATLKEMSQRLFVQNKLTLSFTGDETALAAYLAAMQAEDEAHAEYGNACNDGNEGTEKPIRALVIPDPVHRNEAFCVPSDVTYAGQSFNLSLMEDSANTPFDSAWNVVSRALSFDYLWNEVRVKGGAYGVGFNANRKGGLSFYSYRDPNIDATIERFADAADWLDSFDPNDDEMTGYIVSTVAGFDAPMKPRALSHAQMIDFFAKRDPEWRIKAREQVLAATPEKIRRFAAPVREAQSQEMICVFGNREIIEKSEMGFEVVDLLNE